MAEIWTAREMGSEGWAVFRPHPRRPSLDVMLCNGLTEEDARLIASAPVLQQRVEAERRLLARASDGLAGELSDSDVAEIQLDIDMWLEPAAPGPLHGGGEA